MLGFFKKRGLGSAGALGPVEYMIVGLGNPGSKYQGTRHNAGFMALDAVADKYSAPVKRLKFKGFMGECTIAGKHVILLKPSTFMNLSGQSVTEAMRFYKLKPEQVLILLDDINLAPGKLRIRRKGSDGGQNGLKNIIYLSGSDQFPRVKIGIGAKPHPDYNLADWVLSKFTPAEAREMETSIGNASKAVELLVQNEFEKAMSLYNH